MSDDHKPEDPSEQDRIVKAGGRVTCDGRVNGGLNLSRALGIDVTLFYCLLHACVFVCICVIHHYYAPAP